MRTLFVMFAAVLCSPAAEPLRFEWKTGENHKFTVQQVLTAVETLPGLAASTTSNKLTLAKTWTVGEVDADGSAKMTLTITAMRQELTRPVPGPDGKVKAETDVMDSSTPEGAKMMAGYINKPFVTCRIDPRGRVSEVRTDAVDAGGLSVELPFRLELPEKRMEKWDREFKIKLNPPAGTGEQYEATQSFAIEKTEAGRTRVKLGTSLKQPPKEVAEMQPLLPWLWEGTVYFDEPGKRYLGAKLEVKRDYPNHAGAGSKWSFASTFEETRE